MIELIKGDCLIEMKKIADSSIDMILCDLPYGTTQNKWDSIIPLDLLWKEYERIIKNNGAIVLTATNPFASNLIMSNSKLYKYDLVWNKKRPTGQLNSKRQPLRQHELILVFYKKQPTYNPVMHENRLKRNFVGNVEKSKKQSDNWGEQYDYDSNINNNSKSYPRSIIEQTTVIGNSKEKVAHPTQKPVALFEWLINTFTNGDELILDNTMGSGTTGVACVNTKRNFIGIELDETYFKIAEQRIKEAEYKLF
jgi:site-specific DNA-methyltransferase (adenine-specific)